MDEQLTIGNLMVFIALVGIFAAAAFHTVRALRRMPRKEWQSMTPAEQREFHRQVWRDMIPLMILTVAGLLVIILSRSCSPCRAPARVAVEIRHESERVGLPW